MAATASAEAGPQGHGNRNGNRHRAVPEIPVAGTGAALLIILGGTAIALDRRRRRTQKK